MIDVGNLTGMEISALNDVGGALNLTDGHARLGLTAEQAAIVARLPAMFAEASSRPFADIEREAHEAFLAAVGQHSAPVGSGRILTCYSSTLATDVLARALPAGSTIALLHPTFDNIRDLFVTRGHTLRPLAEEAVRAMDWPAPPVSAVFVVQPNNPTGLVLPAQGLRSLAEHCAANGQTVIIDASFRGQDRRAQYDCYAILDAARADWVVIEDTGKLWPVHELKIGMLVFSDRTRLPIGRAFSESLLSASPVILLLVKALAADWVNGGYERARSIIDGNRRVVGRAAESVGLALADPASTISVARIGLPDAGPDSAVLYEAMASRGVHVLPCGPFHWADRAEGLRYIRLSLARPPAAVQAAARSLAQTYAELATARV